MDVGNRKARGVNELANRSLVESVLRVELPARTPLASDSVAAQIERAIANGAKFGRPPERRSRDAAKRHRRRRSEKDARRRNRK